MKQLIKFAAIGAVAASFALSAAPALATGTGTTDTSGYDYLYAADSGIADDAAASTALAGFSIVFWLVFCCVWLLIMGGMAYFVYSDAKKNGVENGTLWAILTFLFGLIPLIIYFVAIKKNATGGSTPAAK